MSHLRIRLRGGQARYDMYEIEQRDVPEQVVLTEQHHVKVTELSAWLREAIGRLEGTAARLGGIAGPCFVVYFADFMAAGPGDPVCDVAFPVR